MAGDENRRGRGRHEDERRHDRARGQPSDAADAVTAGAAIAPDGAEADEKARADHQRQVARDGLGDCRPGCDPDEKGRDKKAGDEGEASDEFVIRVGRKQPGDDAS